MSRFVLKVLFNKSHSCNFITCVIEKENKYYRQINLSVVAFFIIYVSKLSTIKYHVVFVHTYRIFKPVTIAVNWFKVKQIENVIWSAFKIESYCVINILSLKDENKKKMNKFLHINTYLLKICCRYDVIFNLIRTNNFIVFFLFWIVEVGITWIIKVEEIRSGVVDFIFLLTQNFLLKIGLNTFQSKSNSF